MSTTVDEDMLGESADVFGNSVSASDESITTTLSRALVCEFASQVLSTLCTSETLHVSESVEAPDNKAVCSAAGVVGTEMALSVFSTGVRTGEGGIRTGTTLISEDVGVKVP